jgi:hypothetical protein
MRIRTITAVLLAFAAASGTAWNAAAEDKATEVLAATRKAIGDKKLEALKTLSVEASMQRNVNTMQIASDVEILLELPGRYRRSDSSTGPMSMSLTVGFNGDSVIRPANSSFTAGGGMVIRMGPGGPAGAMPGGGEKLSPEEQERVDKQVLRSYRTELSRLMLGWFGSTHPALNAGYTYAGEAESPDGKAHVIDAKNADGFSARLFIDQATHLPLMVTYQGPQPRVITAGPATSSGPSRAESRDGGPMRMAPGQAAGERREMSEEDRKKAREAAEKQIAEMQKQPPALVEFTIFFEDWQDVGGVKFPHKMRRASGGVTSEEWTVNKVKVNPKIDPKKFDG